ncbi:MAG: OsmC family protein [Nitrospinota bacterium]
MTGNMGGALEARQIPSAPDKLTAHVEGLIEEVNGRPLVTTIRVHYRVRIPKGKLEEAQRALEVHERGCPASQSVRRGIAIEYTGEFEEE